MTAPAITFRPLAPAELGAAASIWHAGWHDAHAAIVPPAILPERTPAAFRTRLAPLLPNARGAFVDGALAGFHVIDGAELYQFYVDAAFRGRGVAPALMADAERALAATGLVEAFLMCAVGNERARRFYTKAGWSEGPEVEGTAWSLDGPGLPVRCHRFTRAL